MRPFRRDVPPPRLPQDAYLALRLPPLFFMRVFKVKIYRRRCNTSRRVSSKYRLFEMYFLLEAILIYLPTCFPGE